MIDYYYVINGQKEPDIESMVSFLIDESVLFVGHGTRWNGSPCSSIIININDWFFPGADSEDVTIDEIPSLFELYSAKKFDGVIEFVSKKRGISPLYWKEEGSDFHSRLNSKL